MSLLNASAGMTARVLSSVALATTPYEPYAGLLGIGLRLGRPADAVRFEVEDVPEMDGPWETDLRRGGEYTSTGCTVDPEDETEAPRPRPRGDRGDMGSGDALRRLIPWSRCMVDTSTLR